MLPEHPYTPEWLVDHNRIINSGCEKIVYPVTVHEMPMAAKIFRPINTSSLKRIDRANSATQELDAYLQTFMHRPLRPYIPKPFELIKDKTKTPVGLLVEWKNGNVLSHYVPYRPIPKKHITDLELVLLTLPPNLYLNADCISEHNLGWDGQGLWFAEPILHSYRPNEWAITVKQWMNYLRDNYCY